MSLDIGYTPVLPSNIDHDSGTMVRPKDNRRITFLPHAELQPIKSRDAGRPIYETKPYIKIEHMGERDFIMRPATQQDANEFPREWTLFQTNMQDVPDGTPLDNLFPANPGVIETLRWFKIRTVEELAGLSDTAMSNIGMGAQLWKQQAVRYLEQAQKGTGMAKLEQENADLKAKLDRAVNNQDILQKRLAELEERFRAQQSEQPRRRQT